MTASRIPGPIGIGPCEPIDDGTLVRLASPLPGPIGLHAPIGRPVDKCDGTTLSTLKREDFVISVLGGSNRNFAFKAGTYRLICARDWNHSYRASPYEIVPPEEARAILDGLAAAGTTTRAEKTALKEAVSLLPAAGSAVQQSKILLLRRAAYVAGAAPSQAPADTGSQGAKHHAPKHDRTKDVVLESIKLRLAPLPYLKSPPNWWPQQPPMPYASEPFLAELTNKSVQAALDGDGRVAYEGIPGGSCEFTFAEFSKEVEKKFSSAGV